MRSTTSRTSATSVQSARRKRDEIEPRQLRSRRRVLDEHAAPGDPPRLAKRIGLEGPVLAVAAQEIEERIRLLRVAEHGVEEDDVEAARGKLTQRRAVIGAADLDAGGGGTGLGREPAQRGDPWLLLTGLPDRARGRWRALLVVSTLPDRFDPVIRCGASRPTPEAEDAGGLVRRLLGRMPAYLSDDVTVVALRRAPSRRAPTRRARELVGAGLPAR